MNASILLLAAMLVAAPAAWAANEPDPNLKPVDETAIEGRAVECQHCEVVMSSPVDRHADLPPPQEARERKGAPVK